MSDWYTVEIENWSVDTLAGNHLIAASYAGQAYDEENDNALVDGDALVATVRLTDKPDDVPQRFRVSGERRIHYGIVKLYGDDPTPGSTE